MVAPYASASPPYKAPPGPGTEFEVCARGGGLPAAAAPPLDRLQRLQKFNEKRNSVHRTRQGCAEQTDGIEEFQQLLEEANGKRRVFTRQDDRGQGREELLALKEANEKRGRHWDIRQGDFGPQDDDDDDDDDDARRVFPFVQHYRTKYFACAKLLIPLDPLTGDPFDEERTNKFFAWHAKLKK